MREEICLVFNCISYFKNSTSFSKRVVIGSIGWGGGGDCCELQLSWVLAIKFRFQTSYPFTEVC